MTPTSTLTWSLTATGPVDFDAALDGGVDVRHTVPVHRAHGAQIWINARVNGVTVDARLVAGDERLPAVAVAVANISLESVQALPARLDAPTLVASGYFASAEPRLDGYEHAARATLDGWACDVYRRAARP